MKRLTAPWTTALATAALLALPAAGNAQTPQTQPEPQPEQSTTLSTPSAQNQNPTQSESPAEHLRQAKAALANVDANNVPARAKSQLATLQRHINSLERSAGAKDNASATGTAQRSSTAASKTSGKANWANDVAAIDRIITELAGSGTASMRGSGQNEAAGTSGAESQTTTKSGKSATAVTLDETSRSQLLEVRSHITAFAAAMSGTSTSSSSSTSPPGASSGMSAGAATSTSAHGSAATGHAGAAATGHAGAATTAPTGSATGETAQAGSTAGQSSSSTPTSQTEPTGQTGTTGQAGSTGTTGQAGSTTAGATGEPGQTAQSSADAEAAKQHLTAARDSLTQLTQLPAAAQLQGDARTQVAQLIQNFNELITTNENWRASYDKVEANLTALLGPAQEGTEAAATPSAAPQAGTPQASSTTPPSEPPASAQGTQATQGTQNTQGTGTEGAVGTSGTAAGAVTLDPALKQKLVDFRNHLKAFHTAASGGGEAK